jgi:hypothetical protein
MVKRGAPPSQGWRTFSRNHAPDIAAMDLFRCSNHRFRHPRSDLWQRRHAPIARHEHPGQAYRTSLALLNGFAERLIGSIRRECVNHIIVLDEMHLRRVLKSHADYYNCVRTHRSLNKDAPVSRPVQRTGVISSRAILGGLHHRYARA